MFGLSYGLRSLPGLFIKRVISVEFRRAHNLLQGVLE